ncbi:MAG: hypothetical protein PHV34_13130 [Verrucomicrobiae bacterium]|nr:hypothetical protein [Verrucomicrobiae bacterium]
MQKLKSEASKIKDEALGALDKLGDQYDAETKHGETQGAVLDTSIN